MDVATFYNDRSILVTGATGFVGKVLVEKLLRSCPGLKRLYVLVRSKGEDDAVRRVDLLKETVLFDRIRNECPNVLDKLVAVEGDITIPELGVSEQDGSSLLQEVSVVIHAAATVRFNQTLRVSSKFNLDGTKNTTDFAKKMPNLKAFVHVSTAYTNCNLSFIEELVYPATVTPQEFKELLETNDDKTLKEMEASLLAGLPNSYTFTKLLGENYLVENCRDLPLIIMRPAIVTAAWKEPFPGWIDNKSGVTGIFVALGKGVLRTLISNNLLAAEFFPVDIGVNQMIVAAWDIATNNRDSKEIQVLNGVSSPLNPLMKTEIPRLSYEVIHKYPFNKPYRYPGCTVTTSRVIFNILYVIQHYFPAMLVDLYLWVRKKNPIAVGLYKKMYSALEEYEFFLLCESTFSCKNVLELQERLSPKDKETFNVSVKDLDWESYMSEYGKGIRRWVLQEKDEDLSDARRNLASLYYKTLAVQVAVGAAVLAWVWVAQPYITLSAFL